MKKISLIIIGIILLSFGAYELKKSNSTQQNEIVVDDKDTSSKFELMNLDNL